MLKKLHRCPWLIGLMFILLPLLAQATHWRAGEIVIEQVGNCGSSLTIRATVITYSEAFSEADRDSVRVCWDDGSCEFVRRVDELLLENEIKRSKYSATHTYSGYGTYFISMSDPNRVANILNINFPNSVMIPFHVFTIYKLSNPLIGGCNESPRLETPPLDRACAGAVWTHNPGAYDPDGDSLSFELTVPLQDVRTPVPNYRFPDQVSAGPSNDLTIDPITGQITWDAPVQTGEYNLAFLVISHRNGIPIDTMIRDMQIFVENCENDPPEIELPFEEICVVAGELLEFDVVATAPLSDNQPKDQKVSLTGTGGPFVLDVSPAALLPEGRQFFQDPLTKRFRWQTTCEHISDQPYFVVFRAVDNFFGDTTGLATLKTVSIKVVGPPPQDVRTEASSESVRVSWELPYVCEDAANGFFLGFTVWRRLNSNSFPPDTCRPGLDGRGYTRLTFDPIRQVENGRYSFVDDEVERGKTYCYRVLAVFGLRTAVGGFIFQEIESLPSEEVCVQLDRDVPLLTRVDVETTSSTDGQINVCWIRPSPDDLDTILNPGPYRYVIQRATGITDEAAAFQPIGREFVAQNFSDKVDTCFTDSGLNTLDNAYSYRVDFYVNNEVQPVGSSNPASSVFLTASPTDEANVLSWEELTPWDNYRYTVFRQLPGGSAYDSIASVTEATYRDTGLVNGQEYCYYIRSEGTYGVPNIISPLFNRSQRTCAVPMDNVPPCPPTLTVISVCDRGIDCRNEDELFNTLNWVNPQTLCPTSDDVAGYRIYYAPFADAEFDLVANVADARLLTYEHLPPTGIAGCYAITAYDDLGNESELSDTVCVDNCPFYELPNAFTPNGDMQNDLYTPFDFCFIEAVDFQVFNRWGQLVFETRDPNINWDGTNQKGEPLAEGTYFYRCQVFERRVDGIVAQPTLLSGYIELIRGRE